uniref:Uncharacterized protein AlNc14C117G6567 n=1 Tax=Albugo laibachii Nc14 TaxID=890382 RepID=F0WJ36_9STRA|nr:conserved hypothetical protein [Albugo laibachii Nc14]CCA21655.1 conserved hypothetical protein [Albugo laibachii Nc14]|eukprot:CCA21655.1 conserved hypothetical protein [Albugo laibachii Nc14]
MSKFTDVEVRNLINYGGNEAARKYWRATFDVSYRAPGLNEGERTRNLLRQTYLDRKWVEISPRERDESTRSNAGGFSNSSNDRDVSKKKQSKTTRSASAKVLQPSANVDFGDFSSFNSDNKDEKPATTLEADDFADFAKFDAPALATNDAGGNMFDQFPSFDGSASKPASMTPNVDTKFMPFALEDSFKREEVLDGSTTQSSSYFFNFDLDPVTSNHRNTSSMLSVNAPSNLSTNSTYAAVSIDNVDNCENAHFGSFQGQDLNKSEDVASFAPFSGAFDIKPPRAMIDGDSSLDDFAEFAPSSTKSHASELSFDDCGHSVQPDVFSSSLPSQNSSRENTQQSAVPTSHSDPFAAFDTLGESGPSSNGMGVMDNTRNENLVTMNENLADSNARSESQKQNLFSFDSISNALPESCGTQKAPPTQQPQAQYYSQQPLYGQLYPLPAQSHQFGHGVANVQSFHMVPCSPYQMMHPSFIPSQAPQAGHPHTHGAMVLAPQTAILQLPQHSGVSQRGSNEKAADPFASLGIDKLGFSSMEGSKSDTFRAVDPITSRVGQQVRTSADSVLPGASSDSTISNYTSSVPPMMHSRNDNPFELF